jgi:hypothetical protein
MLTQFSKSRWARNGGERAATTNAKTAKANREHQERQRDLNRKNRARQADVGYIWRG